MSSKEPSNDFTENEANSIPKNWRIRNLASLVDADRGIRYGIVQPGKFDPNGRFLIRGQDYSKGWVDTTAFFRVSDAIERRYKNARVVTGDLIITIVGASTGEVAKVPAWLNGANLTQTTARIAIDEKKAHPDFVHHMLRSKFGATNVANFVKGGAQPGLNCRDVERFRLPIPESHSEQKAIADALSDADALIEGLERLIAKKKLIKQGAMLDLLTAKRRLPGFAGEWNKSTVGAVITRNFCGPSPTCEERNVSGDEWGVLKTTAISFERGWDWRKHKVLPKSHWGNRKALIEAGDVIVTKAGPRHRVGIPISVDFVPKNILVSGKMIGLKPDQNKAMPLILASAIASKQAQVFLDQRTTGMAESQVNFNNSDLLNTPILLPDIEEQRAISNVAADFDAEIQALDTRLEKARQVKEGMMQNLLTGKIRLV